MSGGQPEQFYVVPYARLGAVEASLAGGQDLDVVLTRETTRCLSPAVSGATTARLEAARGRPVVAFTAGERGFMNLLVVLFNVACVGLVGSIVGRVFGWWSSDTAMVAIAAGAGLFVAALVCAQRAGVRAGRRTRATPGTPNTVD